MTHGIFSGRSALGTDDATGPTTQTLICPTGQAFVEGKCVDNIEQPPKADTVKTTVPAVDTTDIIVNPNAAPPVAASTTGTSIPTWAWVVGAVGLAGLGWYFLGGKGNKVKRNASRKGKSEVAYLADALDQLDRIGRPYEFEARGGVLRISADPNAEFIEDAKSYYELRPSKKGKYTIPRSLLKVR